MELNLVTYASISTPLDHGVSWVLILMEKQQGDNLALSVAMNDAGDRIAVGGHENDGSASRAGHARVYSHTMVQLGCN